MKILHENQVTLDAISWGDFEHPKDVRNRSSALMQQSRPSRTKWQKKR